MRDSGRRQQQWEHGASPLSLQRQLAPHKSAVHHQPQPTCLGAVKPKEMFCAVTKSQLMASTPLSASWMCTCETVYAGVGQNEHSMVGRLGAHRGVQASSPNPVQRRVGRWQRCVQSTNGWLAGCPATSPAPAAHVADPGVGAGVEVESIVTLGAKVGGVLVCRQGVDRRDVL